MQMEGDICRRKMTLKAMDKLKLKKIYNIKYDYNILGVLCQACNIEEYKKSLEEINFPIKIFIYNKNLNFKSKMIYSAIEFLLKI